MSNIGFIGLGIMGRPVAGHLITGGHKLFVHDALDRPAGSPKRLASRSSSSSPPARAAVGEVSAEQRGGNLPAHNALKNHKTWKESRPGIEPAASS
jgi:NAD binding domain of 6-phosphogluconate dehydrogenase